MRPQNHKKVFSFFYLILGIKRRNKMKYYGDYLGFQFGEHHSRDLGLYRVSDGDRYNDVSIPNFTDTTSKIPGGDGTYYWDSFYS